MIMNLSLTLIGTYHNDTIFEPIRTDEAVESFCRNNDVIISFAPWVEKIF